MPLGSGLLGLSLRGYKPFEVRAWTPLGTFGVVRGGIRAATLIAENDLNLLVIPKEIFLKYWRRTYSIGRFKKTVDSAVRSCLLTDCPLD